MLQKVIKVGNSAAVTIPKSFMQEAGINIGDNIYLEPDLLSKSILMKTKKLKGRLSVSQESKTWIENFIKKYRPMLEELAKK